MNTQHNSHNLTSISIYIIKPDEGTATRYLLGTPSYTVDRRQGNGTNAANRTQFPVPEISEDAITTMPTPESPPKQDETMYDETFFGTDDDDCFSIFQADGEMEFYH